MRESFNQPAVSYISLLLFFFFRKQTYFHYRKTLKSISNLMVSDGFL